LYTQVQNAHESLSNINLRVLYDAKYKGMKGAHREAQEQRDAGERHRQQTQAKQDAEER
jgi:hypothetical protein